MNEKCNIIESAARSPPGQLYYYIIIILRLHCYMNVLLFYYYIVMFCNMPNTILNAAQLVSNSEEITGGTKLTRTRKASRLAA